MAETKSCLSALFKCRFIFRGSSRSSTSLMRGSRVESESCSISWTSRRYFLNSGASIFCRSLPRYNTCPPEGRTSPAKALARVVLPEPLSPTRPSISPFFSSILTSETALMVWSGCFKRTSGLCLTTKWTDRFSAFNTASSRFGYKDGKPLCYCPDKLQGVIL